MENNSMEFTLPPAPGGLCFDRNDFVKRNFSVDSFLAEHQNSVSLETMRDDLGAYLKVLRLAMIELINKDYANFVNLSATLIGFDKVILNIQVPLGQLKEEVLRVKKCLEDAMKELTMWMSQRHALQKKKQLLKYYSHTIHCLNTLENVLQNINDKKKHEQIIMADRSAMQYNQLKFSITVCNSIVKQEQKTQFHNVGATLTQTLNDLVFYFYESGDENNLLKTLITLASLDRVRETEVLIRKQVVAPLLQTIVNEPALQRSNNGLEGIYNSILTLLETKLKMLNTVMRNNKLNFLTKKYRFLVNCFWCEVESRLEVNLASIFAPGNPKIFYKRYNESMNFIRKLKEYCTDVEMVNILMDTAEYKSFQKRWNLPVYFQIRFQEIAGSNEAALQNGPTIENKNGFILKETNRCWESLQVCWSDGVYIGALAHKFWKLCLQLLSRYVVWSKTFCANKCSTHKFETSINKSLIQSCINIYVDIKTLLQRLPQFIEQVENKAIIISERDIFKKSLEPSKGALHDATLEIKGCIVGELFGNFNIQLKQVSDIPRLYRKTNRSVPSEPCAYIETVRKSINEFHEDVSRRLDGVFLSQIYEELFNRMTVSYYKYVVDVLTSVQKTEESLRRLKQIRENSSQQNNETSGLTDGDKIRLQLNVDVVSFGVMAESVRVNVKNIGSYKELTNMVTEAVKNIDIK